MKENQFVEAEEKSLNFLGKIYRNFWGKVENIFFHPTQSS